MNKTSRQKLEDALAHKQGKVPFDIGATAVTGMHCSVVEGLRKHYGLENRPVKICDPYQMLGLIEDDLKDAIGVDVETIRTNSDIFGLKQDLYKDWKTPWGQDVLVSSDFNVTVNDKNEILAYPCGDKNAEPCARMPVGGYFFDTIIRGNTYDEDDEKVEENLEEFGILSDDAISFMQKQISQVAQGTRGIVAPMPGCALGDIALVPAPMLKNPKGLRDISEWYMATVANPEYIHEIFERQTEIALKNLEIAHKTLGDAISVAYICGTDFGTQNAQFCSNETFRSLYMPYYKQINGWIHQNTNWKTFKHSCGAIRKLLPDLIEAGFDIINPVQWSANDMDAKMLKADFGKDITFWGGGVNTQKTLPFGTPSEVREEVLSCLDIFA